MLKRSYTSRIAYGNRPEKHYGPVIAFLTGLVGVLLFLSAAAMFLKDISSQIAVSDARDIVTVQINKSIAQIMQERYPEYLSYPEWTYHQFTGAFLAETIFGIKDPAILDAISCHATGKAHMSPLAKTIYATDKIEPLRGFDSRKLIQSCLKNYYVGFMTVLAANKEYLASKGYVVDNPLTKQCFDLYLGEEE